MIYEPSGLYEIVMHEKDELGNGNFGYVLTLERIVELCACFGGQIGSHVYSLWAKKKEEKKRSQLGFHSMQLEYDAITRTG